MGKKDTTIKDNPSGRSKTLSLGKSILSLDPAIAVHMCSAVLVLTAVQDSLLDKACRVNIGYSDEVCDALQTRKTKGFEKEEQAVQTFMGQALMLKTFLENIFPMLLVFLVGAWSDKYGRKYPIVAVLAAYIIQDVLLILSAFAGNYAGVWTLVILSSVFISLSGNQPCFISTAFSHTTDHTPIEKRTVRGTITHSLIFFGITVGMASGGYLVKSGLGFTKIISIALGLEFFSLLYILVAMENHPLPGVTKGKTAKEIFMDLFTFENIKDVGKCIVKKREGNNRLKLFMLLLCHSCSFMMMMGEMSVLYLFCRYKFNWDAAVFGSFMSFKTVLGFLASFVSIGILGGKLKLSDPQNGIVSCLANLVANVLYSVASSGFIMVTISSLSLLTGALLIVPRSMISKIIPAEEMGKINSCIGGMQALYPFLAGSLYTSVYTAFIDVYPGSFFLITAALMIPPIFIYSWMQNDKGVTKKSK